MNRRSLLASAATIPFLRFLSRQLRSPAAAGEKAALAAVRRVRPSDAAWPSPADWERLSRDIGGRLVKVLPLFASCANPIGSCGDVLPALKNPYYVGDQPAGTQTVGWVDGWMAAPSVYAVAARTSQDVVAAVNFARDNNLRLVVKGGGPQLPGHVQRARFPSDLDAAYERYRDAYRIRSAGMRTDYAITAGGDRRRGNDLDAGIRRGYNQGREIRPGGRMHNGRRGGPD